MIKEIAIVAALLALVFTAMVYSKLKAAKAANPPAGVTNIVAFLKARPEATRIDSFSCQGKIYTAVYGKQSVSPLVLASGPPVYVFDDTGALVDWSSDIGDDPDFVDKWGGFSNAVPLSIEDVKQSAQAHNGEGK